MGEIKYIADLLLIIIQQVLGILKEKDDFYEKLSLLFYIFEGINRIKKYLESGKKRKVKLNNKYVIVSCAELRSTLLT